MKSKNTLGSVSTSELKSTNSWSQDFKNQMERIKRPFLNRVQYSKLRVQSRIQDFKSQKQAWLKYEGIIQCLIQKLLQNQLPPANQISEHQITEQSQEYQSQKNITNSKQPKFKFEDDSEDQKQNQVHVQSYFTEWKGRDKQKLFKNSTNMVQQFDKVFNKKTGITQAKKKTIYSYRKEEKLMLERIFDELQQDNQNTVTFEKIYNFFDTCKLFFTVYGISPLELKDVVTCSAHKYPDRLTKDQFFELFLINAQSRNYDEVENKDQKVCVLDDQNWDQLQRLFYELDTFGCGTVKTCEFFHKMKTISASKQLLNAQTIYYTNVNRYYSLTKILFDLQHKKSLPQILQWGQLKSLIQNFTHITYPTIDQICKSQIQIASISKQSNTFMLKQETLNILKDEFQRCPKFCENFVKCKYFCEQLLSMEAICLRSKQFVRNNFNGKGFVNLHSNIRQLQFQGPEYFDMDQMLTYFSVKGFEHQAKINAINTYKDSFDLKSTSSQEQFEEKKRQERKIKRMKSLDQMEKVMRRTNQVKFDIIRQNKKPVFKPVKVEQFNLTKPRQHLTIRQQKVNEMIKQKQLKQQQQIKPYIPANPIPASINPQRYLSQKNRQQTKRQLQKEKRQRQHQEDDKRLKYLMSNTKLFEKKNPLLIEQEKKKFMSPQSKQFEAKPICWFVRERNLLENIQSEKEQRRKNRLRQTKQKYVFGYWKDMPYKAESKFKKMTIAQNVQKNKTFDSLELKIRQINESVLQDTKYKTTVVPDFAKLQKEFMQELESKKKMKSPTVVKEFNLSVSKRKQPKQAEKIEVVKQVQPAVKIQQAPGKQAQPVIVETTKKFASMVEMTQQKMAMKKLQEKVKQLEEKDRKKKQKVFAKYMQKVMREEGMSSKRERKTEKSTTRRDRPNQSQINHEKQLEKIYERVLKRPFLFQNASQSQPQLQKKSRKGSKQNQATERRAHPQKVKIPSEPHNESSFNNLCPMVLPLNYIQQQEFQQYPPYQDQDGNVMVYDGNERRYVMNEFNGGDEDESCYEESQVDAQKFRGGNERPALNLSF